eukprot:269252_1
MFHRQMHRTNKHNAYIYRATNVACYSSHQLQFDVSCKDFESGDTCKVYYKYDSGLKQVLETFESAEGVERWPQNRLDLPNASSASTAYVYFETNAQDTSQVDKCYWDNVYLYGIQE